MKFRLPPGAGWDAIPRITQGSYIYMRKDALIMQSRPDQPRDSSFCGDFYRAQLEASASGIPWIYEIFQYSAHNFAVESNDTWKDVLTRGQFGTLWMIINPDGTTYHPADHTCPDLTPPEDEDMPWSVVKEWSFAVDGAVANIDYPIEDGITELYVIMDAVTASVAGFRRLVISTDGGASYFTGLAHYNNLVGAGTVGGIQGMMISSSSGTAALTGWMWLVGLNLGNRRVITRLVTTGSFGYMFVANNDPVTDVRLQNTAGNLNGGKMTILGR